MKRGLLFCAVLLMAFVSGLSACNTVQGVGKDIQAGGRAVEKAAK
jgi:entericidin B